MGETRPIYEKYRWKAPGVWMPKDSWPSCGEPLGIEACALAKDHVGFHAGESALVKLPATFDRADDPEGWGDALRIARAWADEWNGSERGILARSFLAALGLYLRAEPAKEEA